MNNIKATFADTRGPEAKSRPAPSDHEPRRYAAQAGSGVKHVRQPSPFIRHSIRSKTSATAAVRWRPGAFGTDHPTTHALPDMFCQKPRVETPRFRASHEKRPIGIRLPPRPAERMKRHSKSLSQPFYANKTTHIG